MKVLQLNLNHCEAAHDLLMQTVRVVTPDVALISEPYRHLPGQPKAAIWSCGKFPFQSVATNKEAGFVVAKMDGVHFSSCYAPPSLSSAECMDFPYRLTKDAKQHSQSSREISTPGRSIGEVKKPMHEKKHS